MAHICQCLRCEIKAFSVLLLTKDPHSERERDPEVECFLLSFCGLLTCLIDCLLLPKEQILGATFSPLATGKPSRLCAGYVAHVGNSSAGTKVLFGIKIGVGMATKMQKGLGLCVGIVVGRIF